MNYKKLISVVLISTSMFAFAACDNTKKSDDDASMSPSMEMSQEPSDSMSDDAMSDDAMSDDAMSDDTMSDDAMSDDAMSDGGMSDDEMSDDMMTNDQ